MAFVLDIPSLYSDFRYFVPQNALDFLQILIFESFYLKDIFNFLSRFLNFYVFKTIWFYLGALVLLTSLESFLGLLK